MDKALDAAVLVSRHCRRRANVLKGYRARARQEASNIAFQGFPFTIAVIAARSSASALEDALKDTSLEVFIKRLCEDSSYARRLGVTTDEGQAYALYGFALLHILRSIGLVVQQSFQSFMKKDARNPLVGQTALHAAIWMKRFAEAYIYDEKNRD